MPRFYNRWWRVLWANLALVVLLFGIAASALFYARDSSLSQANADRIADIQASRIASCRQTYEAFREVFRPFFRPVALRSPKEQADIDKFNATVDELKQRCGRQTKPKGGQQP